MTPRRQITYSEHPNRAARAAHAKGEKAFRTYDTSAIRPKRSPVPAIIAMVILVVALGAIIWGIVSFTHGCSATPQVEKGTKVEITISEGEPTRSVAKALVDAGLISNANDFTNRVNQLGASATLHPGTFTLTGGMTVDEIIQVLSTPVAAVTFTVPEGSTLQQTAQIVAEASGGRIAAESFMTLASNASNYAGAYPFLESVGSNSLEGFLFPKTYPIDDSSTAESVIRMMLDQFQIETASLDLSVASAHGLSFYDMVKLASMIERETDENYRATVSSVFYNRLDEGMMLQSDATLAYIVGGEPTPEQLESDDPYNTYTHYGFPPTPVCSPGLGCMQAACAPESTDYLYFYIAPNESGVVEHYFSRTHDEHMASYQ